MNTDINRDSQLYSDTQYLIISGTTKSATTSLFRYLEAHPRVCVSNMKETRFFLDVEYPLSSKYRLKTDGLQKYNNYFSLHEDGADLRVEATPDYLYSPGTPTQIARSLKKVRLVFVLREPISRILSWYRFARQNNLLETTVTLDKYIKQQLYISNDAEMSIPQYMRSLEQGRYSNYLRAFFDVFGKELIKVIFFEDLSRNPQTVMQSLCRFAEIDESFYMNYNFEIHNQSKIMRNPVLHRFYVQTRFILKKMVHNRANLLNIMRKIRGKVEPFYMKLNSRSFNEEMHIAPELMAKLQAYYRPYNDELFDLTGKPVPWTA